MLFINQVQTVLKLQFSDLQGGSRPADYKTIVTLSLPGEIIIVGDGLINLTDSSKDRSQTSVHTIHLISGSI